MGIQGLLPFLKKIHTPVTISQFKGCTVAIDAYCWLHKGAFACAEKLALGEKTEQYVYYCMKYVDCLLRNGLKPILVFDGCHLPSKKDVEVSRRERREMNRKKAAQLLRDGKRTEARECLQRCIDVTPQMALQLMNVCRARGVDCIVAPYEADAQLAYLNKAGIAQIIITEDSDLLLFGCERVIFKMDVFGNGVLIEQSRLNEVVDIQDGFYTFEKFRYMCILSGCDYLPSLPGIGLAKACKVFKVARQADIRQLLRKVPSYLRMGLVVTDDYIDGFIRADNTFLYQLTFDPLTGKLCPLTPYLPEVEVEELKYAGPYFSDRLALQIALGNVDIHTREAIADFDPQTYVPKHAKKPDKEMRHMRSIWSSGYRPRSEAHPSASEGKAEETDVQRPCLAGKEVRVKNTVTRRSPVKHVREVPDSVDVKTDTELADLYSAPNAERKRRRDSEDDLLPQLSTPTPSKPPKRSDSGDRADDMRSQQKQVLSPSKSSNQTPRRPVATADDALPWTDPESAVGVSAEEKENVKKSASTPKRNKFAVSALAKRAKFSLDAPSLPNIKVEVKSRYFSSTPTSSTSSAPEQESKTPGNASHTAEDSAGSACSTKGQEELTSPNTDQLDLDKSASKQKLERLSVSPVLSAKDRSSLSKFSFSSDKCDRKTQPVEPANAKQVSSSQSKVSKTSGKPSPGSVFSWSSFKFSKSSSTPTLSSFVHTNASSNMPFKRVGSGNKMEDEESSTLRSGNKVEDEEPSTPNCNLPDSQGDMNKASQDSVGDVGGDSHLNRLSGSSQQGDGGDNVSDLALSQRSTSDVDASQHSNLYSIDSDCFPTSQDFVDLTDCDSSLSGKSGGASDRNSPATSSQMFLKTPKSTPRTTSGIGAKCRVSGLSRGKKKTSQGADEKQQKIRDMFSRFTHTKKKQLDSLPETRLEDYGSSTGPETPSASHRQHPTGAHRRLLI